ncbi:MAG TPA: MerR family transcriptional regulator [Egibacteraceae bacterium]|nr:MerR family transcriptional regulator [Actinomycetota bacterium]HWB72428.1 MerR family transcriptional regulator [Egibacteraceae bacterium]
MSAMGKAWEERLGDEDAPIYPIGVVADLLGVSVQVVRRYDDPGLVEPDRSDSGQRRYSRRDIARLARVLQLADDGVSSAGIRRILDLEEQLDAAQE